MSNKNKIKYNEYEIHSERDWLIILCVSLVLLLAVSSVGFYFYRGVADGTLFTAPMVETTPAPIIDVTRLHAIVSSFKERAATFTALKSDPKGATASQAVDPSL